MTTISYELAKELKDAGFPQMNTYFAWVRSSEMAKYEFVGGFTAASARDVINETGIGAYVSAPTLEELIEACERSTFFDIVKCADGWIATDHYHRGEGPTHTEAVARLWLALKKKV